MAFEDVEFVRLVQTTASAIAKDLRHGAPDDAELRLEVLHLALLESPGLVFAVDADGHSPLHWIAQLGSISLLQLFLDHDAPLLVRDKNGLLPLHWAAAANNLPALQLLLAQPESCIDDRDVKKGQTPLVLAARHGHAMAVLYLLKHGANPSIVDSAEDNFVHWAAYKGNVEILSLCHTYASAFGVDFGLFRALDAFGQSPLHLAANQGHLGCVEYLIEELDAGVDVCDAKGHTPLQLAQLRGHASVVAYLARKFAPAWNRQLGHALYFWCRHAMNAEAVSLQPFLSRRAPLYFMVGNSALGVYWLLRMDKTSWAWTTQFVLQAMAWSGFVCAASIAPGAVIHEASLRDSYTASMVRLLSDCGDDGLHLLENVRLCHTCCVEKPIGSKHCRFCKTCILRFDHHCPFINNCVGQRNYTFFLLYVGAMAAASGHLAYNWAIHGTSTAGSVLGALYYGGVGVVAGNLFCFHLFLASIDVSTNEYRNRHRYTHLKDRKFGSFTSPCSDDCVPKCLARLCMSLPPLPRGLRRRASSLKSKLITHESGGKALSV
ncbi:hypothetical protein SPRG_08413 [Saprolegnia parasitica CBS 223.65]|uniref:Palmitoyltransferase n=1 Tax=Saprolegnia parasitica (strain CBS 223.65) TaxID=695850 RepID=A0A067CAY6_SAPPC|nr:hypothetical protein SPRG_08413 [Saprolegnia parasitica CBS 223.65]KDO26340.1 hypothetical protein SPRG_08413 [Saprolegnia parasitica CBS 223.65]|eukprot:XP_012203039.1 hypothetical protein SPRG_08413 [Saprolegnia parasitica CBS 223.65]